MLQATLHRKRSAAGKAGGLSTFRKYGRQHFSDIGQLHGELTLAEILERDSSIDQQEGCLKGSLKKLSLAAQNIIEEITHREVLPMK